MRFCTCLLKIPTSILDSVLDRTVTLAPRPHARRSISMCGHLRDVCAFGGGGDGVQGSRNSVGGVTPRLNVACDEPRHIRPDARIATLLFLV